MFRALATLLLDWKAVPPASSSPRHVLLVRWDGKLGDAVVSSFVYRELRKALPVHIAVVTSAPLAELHRRVFQADQVLITRTPPGWLELLRLARRLRGVDAVVHLVGRIQARELFFLRLLKPQQIYSLDDALGCVTGKMAAHTTGMSFAEKYAQVLQHMGVHAPDRASLLEAPGPQPGGHQVADIAFNPYASRPDKSLSVAKAAQTLICLADALPMYRFLIVSSAATHAEAQQLARRVARSNVDAGKGLGSVEDVIALIGACRAVVTVDTGLVHVAVGVNKPLLAIYPDMGDFNPWLPPTSSHVRVVHVGQDVNLYRSTGMKNMNSYADEAVLHALQELLRVAA